MKNLVTESDFVETYDDFLTESICSELISLVNEQNERIERDHKPNFYQRNIGDLPEYTGLYKKFSSLEKHTDRDSCEVTVSVNVAADLEWPLFIDNERVIIHPGDGVLYFGAKFEHWREEYDGDHSLQIFLHYVLEDGKYKNNKWDKRQCLGVLKNAF